MTEEVMWHELGKDEAIKKLNSSGQGISSYEADLRLKKYGSNQIREIHKIKPLVIFLKQFNSLLVYILILASVISAMLSNVIDAVVIAVIIILNSTIGFAQEYKAERTIEKLKEMLVPYAKVIREDRLEKVIASEIVPGDIIVFSEGDKIMADARLVHEVDLEVNEAVLTGESMPEDKSTSVLALDTPLTNMTNMVYMGTTVVKGSGKAVVVSTGMSTEFGKIAGLVQKVEDQKTPLQKKLDLFSKQLGIVIIILSAIITLIGIAYGLDKIKMFLLGVSLAVSAIPEGLPAVIAVTLAVIVQKMSKANVLIRKLPAAETLGRTTVICTDKTGTLTEEKMAVVRLYSGNKLIKIDRENTKNLNEKIKEFSDLKMLLKIGVLCSNIKDGITKEYETKKEREILIGDPTEKAFIEIARSAGLIKEDIEEKEDIVREFSFTSSRKMMSIVRESINSKGNKEKISYAKGAPEVIMERCSKEIVNGKIIELNDDRKKVLMKAYHNMASDALRVLAFAYKEISIVTQNMAENNLIFAGFQGMLDPPRKEIKEAIKKCKDAGIRVIMITGDSAITAKAISSEIGLEGDVISDFEIEKLSDEELTKDLAEISIFARISPKSKLRIVELLKKKGEIVAVTGDGINDVLALKKADIGIAMGIRGTDAARDTSDMILVDDNFASIVNAVHEGRHAYDNIQKFTKFLLSVNFSEIGLILFSIIMNLPLPLLPLQILWINLVTDSFPALALGVEPSDKDIMKRKSKPKDGILKGAVPFIIIGGVFALFSKILMFLLSYDNMSIEKTRTMVLTTVVMFEMFFVFSCKSDKSILKKNLFNNKWLIYSVLFVILLQIIVIYTPLRIAFSLVPLTLTDWIKAVAIGSIGFICFESYKIIKDIKKTGAETLIFKALRNVFISDIRKK